ncbi:MAG TPA: Holliday junction resolvase RuvX [Dehalococcoidia bacterium]|nr:Holliday junction resolvase RuvX [Dehalococcoidia bacterium]
MRIVGLDLGEKRIGVAAADDRTRVAIPVTTVTVTGDEVDSVVSLLSEQRADGVVIGLPLSLSGAIGPQGQHVLEVVEKLRARLPIPVHTWDERLTTVQASRTPRGSRGYFGPRRGKSARSAIAGRDAAAAAIMLQAFIDSGANF